MQQVFTCSRCGTQNVSGQKFCVGCGTPLVIFCPYCGASMPPTSVFCTNCGGRLSFDSQQPLGVSQPAEGKPTSGWAKVGTVLFILGVLCIIIGPVTILLRPPAEQTTGLMLRYVIAGAICLIIGLPLMFRR